MNIRLATLLLAAGLACTFAAGAATKDEKRQDVRDVAQNTLARLYKSQPQAKDAIERAAGYAVFSNFGMKILFAGRPHARVKSIDTAAASACQSFARSFQSEASFSFMVIPRARRATGRARECRGSPRHWA